MPPLKRTVAIAETLLVLPSALFMTALFVRNLQPLQYEPAHTAERIVSWYAARPHIALWGFLMTLPSIVLLTGGTMVLRAWNREAELRQAGRQAIHAIAHHFATFLIAGATVTAGGILAIVALHLLTD